MDNNNRSAIKTKKRNFYIRSLAVIVLALALVVFATLLAYKAPFKYDMTAQKLFTLSEETKTVVAELDGPVRIGAVYAEGNEEAMVAALLNEYDKLSEDVSVEYLDAEKNPSVLADWNIGEVSAVANGTLIINSGERYKLIAAADLFSTGETGNLFHGEGEITGAIRYVTAKDLPAVYFAQGHGEISTGSDLTEAVKLLQNNAYSVDNLTLLQSGRVPDGAALVIFASPKEDLTDEEFAMLEDYLGLGGKIMLLLDPVLSGNSNELNNFARLSEVFGVGIPNSYVYEEDSDHYMTVSNLYLIPYYGTHEITAQIINDQKLTVLPMARGLVEAEAQAQVSPLLLSSEKSWMRTDMTISSSGKTEADTGGPVALAYASAAGGAGAECKAVIVGDANFVVNGNLNMQANSDFFINSVNWLTGGRETEVIAGKVINAGSLLIKSSNFTTLVLFVCVIIPAIMFAGAVLVWRARKNK